VKDCKNGWLSKISHQKLAPLKETLLKWVHMGVAFLVPELATVSEPTVIAVFSRILP